MWSLIDIIETSKTPIYTVCTGHAFSAGFQIFLAGHKRYIGRHAVLMYHQLYQNEWGKYQDIKEQQPIIDKYMEMIENYVIEKTGWNKKFLTQIREKKQDYYIFAEDFVNMGLAEFVSEIGKAETATATATGKGE